LQTPPLHVVPDARGVGVSQTPAVQDGPVVQSLPSSGQSAASMHPTQLPNPSHMPPVQGVSAGVFVTTQAFAVQVAGSVHSFPSSVQSVAATHSTQLPAPSQNPSPTATKLHAVPEGEGVLPGHPLTGSHVPSSVHWMPSSQVTPPLHASSTQVTLRRRL
jgi:hypothetical protein